jgi:hypothetical protein
MALATAGALVATTPIAIGNAAAPTPEPASATFDVDLLSKSQQSNSKWSGYSSDDDDDDDDYEYQGNGQSYNGNDDDDDDDDDDDGWRGGFGSFVTDFLANNQAEVIAVTAMIPVFNLGPVPVGNSLLANAYYDGYNGSATGVDGVVSYVTSQIGVPPADLVQGLVLGATSLIPRFNLGPVAVGNSLLATAYYSGYNGSATGIPGLVSYVTSAFAPAPAAALKASAVKASAVKASAVKSGAAAAASIPSVAAARSAVEVAEAGDNSAAGTAKADSVRAERSVSGRVVAKAARAAGQAKASGARARAESAADAS